MLCIIILYEFVMCKVVYVGNSELPLFLPVDPVLWDSKSVDILTFAIIDKG